MRSSMHYENVSQTDPRPRGPGRRLLAVRLWLADAALARFGHYHWQRRRRRLEEFDRRQG